MPAEERGAKVVFPPWGADGRPDPLEVIRGSGRSDIGLRSESVRHHRPIRQLPESLASRVIQVDDRCPSPFSEHREEPSLRLEIVLHCRVEIEVILRQVREDGDVKGASLYPMHGEGV